MLVFLGWFCSGFSGWSLGFRLGLAFNLLFCLKLGLLLDWLFNFDFSRLLLVLCWFWLFFAISNFHQFTQVETIHVMNMRVDTFSFPQINMISFVNKLDQARVTNFHQIVNVNYFYISLLQRIVNNLFIFQRRDRTSWVNHYSANFSAVDCG